MQAITGSLLDIGLKKVVQGKEDLKVINYR